MPQTDIRTLITIESDNKGVESARQALKQIVKEQQDLVDAFKRGEKDVAAYNKEMAKLQKQEKDIKKAIDDITGEFTDQAQAIKDATEESRKLAKQQEELKNPNAGFEAVSRNVAGAGDTESALRTLSGGIGFVGGDVGAQLEKNINILSEGFAALEAAPKLQASIKGMPAVINSAAQALGTSGAGLIGAIGAVGIAVAALSIAFQAFEAEQQKQAEAVKGRIQAISDVNQQISNGLTTEEARAKIDELKASNEGYTATLDTLQTTYDKAIGSAGAAAGAVQLLSGAEEELSQGIDKTKGSINANNQSIQDLQRALDNGTLAANDAAEAERKLAQERTQGILSQSRQAGDLETARQQTVGATQDQLDSLAQTERNHIANIKAQLEVLNQQNDGSEAVAKSIADLNAQLDTAQQKLQIFQGAVGQTDVQAATEGLKKSAQDRVTSIKAEINLLKQSGNTSKATQDKIAELEKELSGMGDTATSAATAIATASKQVSDSAKEVSQGPKVLGSLLLGNSAFMDDLKRRTHAILGIKDTPSSTGAGTSGPSGATNDILKKQMDLNNQLAKARLDTARKLEDLKTTLKDNVSDAFEQGNFLGLADIAKEASRSQRDIRKDDARRLQDIQDSANQQLLQSVQNTNSQRLQIEAQGQQASLSQFQSYWQQMQRIQTKQLNGSSIFQTATRTS